MAPDMQHPKAPQVIRLGHPSRLTPDTLEVTLLVLGHLVVFFLSLAHDEITAELVEDGWLMASLSERFEILIGLVLFLCWSALLLRLVHVLRRVREDALPEQSDS